MNGIAEEEERERAGLCEDGRANPGFAEKYAKAQEAHVNKLLKPSLKPDSNGRVL